ncbi:glycoside hydrolase [Ganoderma leucocontextum]|nr:glycoside hydrolase [Ganoderma leucocontextum]
MCSRFRAVEVGRRLVGIGSGLPSVDLHVSSSPLPHVSLGFHPHRLKDDPDLAAPYLASRIDMAFHGVPRPQPTHNLHGALGSPQNPQGHSPIFDARATPSIRISEVVDPALPSTPFLERTNPAPSPPSKEVYYGEPPRSGPTKRPFYKRPCVWIGTGVLLTIIVVVTVYSSARIKQESNNNANHSSNVGGAGQGGDPSHPGSHPKTAVVTGGDGSTVTKEDDSIFTYHNPFGGYWVYDAANPFNNSARANAWTPPLSASWNWSRDRIHGVNLGGLFVLEPFISPALFEQNPHVVDEWTLSAALLRKGQLQQVLEEHYSTFITEEDIAEIAGAGLNWIRVPIPFWAVEAWDDVGVDVAGQKVSEPFLPKICWKYIVRVLQWARKYGLRVLLDLHTVPGSQNGYNHSGKYGSINWLNGVMGLANAQRTLDIVRSIVEFASQPEWQSVIMMVGVVNEPYLPAVGQEQLQSFYYEAYKMIRDITGVGEGKGPMIIYHDGFDTLERWGGFLTGADRIAIDTHVYFAFGGNANREPVNVTAEGGDGTMMGGPWPKRACDSWGPSVATSRKAFGISIAGEFSNAINDCGQWVLGVDRPSYYGPGEDYWEDASRWSQETKQGLLNFAKASMDALGDWFFWTWKVGNSSATNSVRAPLWSYKLGLEGGWMPKDPRDAAGTCAKLGTPAPAWDGVYQPWQTGGTGAGQVTPAAAQKVLPWPPQMANVVPGPVPQYMTPSAGKGSPVTLPPPAFAAAAPTMRVGNGWANAKDTTPAVTAIPGCAYPNAWDALEAQAPAVGCDPAGFGEAQAVPPAIPSAPPAIPSAPPAIPDVQVPPPNHVAQAAGDDVGESEDD